MNFPFDVARRNDVDNLRIELRGEIAELRGEMAELRAELRGEMAELRSEFHGLIPRVMLANLPIMFGVAGLVLAAAKLT